MAKQIYTLTPLTGVHIGTGEELTFLDYKIISKLKDIDYQKPRYVKFSNDRILQRILDDEEKMSAFERASVSGNIKELQKFFQINCVSVKDVDYPCDITENFYTTYKANLSKDSYQNAAKVLAMYHIKGKPGPVIPGSSLKGSIRTALLNHFLDELPDNQYEYWSKESERNKGRADDGLQKELFRFKDAKNDPLRTVSIPDCPFKSTGNQLVGGLNLVSFNKNEETLEAIGTQIQAEVIKGELLGGKAISEIAIGIDEKLQSATTPQSGNRLFQFGKKISFDDIHKSCNDFYLHEFQNEYDKFYKDVSDGTEKLIVKLKERLEEAANTTGQFITRVGRWSQVEFVTFDEDIRQPLIKNDRNGRPLGYGGTRTLFDFDGKYVPMGWCVLTAKGE